MEKTGVNLTPNSVYYFDAVGIIDTDQKIPYYLESKIRDLNDYLSVEDKHRILEKMLFSNNPFNVFKYFQKRGIVYNIFPQLERLSRIPQNKGKSKNAFDHTLRVISETPNGVDAWFRWAALFHDLGKFESWKYHENFYKHHLYSTEFARYYSEIFDIEHKDKIITIVRNHMYPLDYQKNPNWTDKAIHKFIEKCKPEHALDVVEFSFYDKKAENDVEEYLKIIEDFYVLVKEAIGEKYGADSVVGETPD